jgi:predicted nucleic acid-binding protein
LQEFYVVATRKLSVDPLTARRAIYLLPNFDVVTITVPLIELAIDINVADQLSFWDALIAAAATSADCDEIWTEDLQHGQMIRGVRITNPLAQGD